jgi:glucose/arabinose dehydrogenase
MFSRAIAFSVAVAALTLGSSGTSGMIAHAASPPLPTSTNGHPVQLVASGLKTPTSFAFGDGSVFEGDAGNSEGSAPPNGAVYVLKNGEATAIPGSPAFVGGLAWHNNALYVSGGVLTATGASWRLLRWTGWNGTTFKTQKTIYTAPKKFDGFNGLGFGANDRLYVGADVGLLDGNDHGPATTSPHVYQILSFSPNGTHRKVVARGIRQPWQMAFPAGSSSPYVTDLGQDSGAKNPQDFILRVKSGQNYGFPRCNHTSAKKCKGFAKPHQSFGPHTDLMGIGLHGGNLYLTSFQGPKAKGPGGEVFSLSRKGGSLKPLIKGFVAPTVGLGIHGGYLYVGELTGQVFRLKL